MASETTSDRKSQIVAGAAKLFAHDGFERVTVKRIASSCGITEPAVYRYFDSKEEVFVAALESLKSRLDFSSTFKELRGERDVEKLLHSIATHIVEFYSQNTDIYRLLLFSALRGHPGANKTYNAIRGTYQEFLKVELDRLFQEGLILEKNNEITARCFIGMVFDCALGTTLWKGMQGKVFRPTETINNNIPIYAKGLMK